MALISLWNSAVDAAGPFRFKTLMNRAGETTVEELRARIAALQAENHQLADRVVKLEEELALTRLHRVALRSEKHIDRLFNEAEQVAVEADGGENDANGEEGDVAELPDTGLPPAKGETGKKRGRRPLPENLPRERVEYDLPEDQKSCPCCRHQMHRMGETVTEQLHIEVKARVLQNARLKYACRHCDRTGINTPCRDRADARAAFAGQHRHGIDAGLCTCSQICRRHTALPP